MMNNPPLFDFIPYQRHSQTSGEAADAITHKLGELERLVLRKISFAADGLTDEEGMNEAGLSGSTYRPRRVRLVELGRVRDSGRTRKTASGRNAVVWEAT